MNNDYGNRTGYDILEFTRYFSLHMQCRMMARIEWLTNKVDIITISRRFHRATHSPWEALGMRADEWSTFAAFRYPVLVENLGRSAIGRQWLWSQLGALWGAIIEGQSSGWQNGGLESADTCNPSKIWTEHRNIAQQCPMQVPFEKLLVSTSTCSQKMKDSYWFVNASKFTAAKL